MVKRHLHHRHKETGLAPKGLRLRDKGSIARRIANINKTHVKGIKNQKSKKQYRQ